MSFAIEHTILYYGLATAPTRKPLSHTLPSPLARGGSSASICRVLARPRPPGPAPSSPPPPPLPVIRLQNGVDGDKSAGAKADEPKLEGAALLEAIKKQVEYRPAPHSSPAATPTRRGPSGLAFGVPARYVVSLPWLLCSA